MKIEQLTIYYQHNLLLDDHILKILAENLPDTLYSIRSCSFWLGNDEYGNQLLNEIKENGVEIITIKNSDLLLRE
ncbi:hypothetical protein GLOIN_2v1774887 [Rhizophagus irregularis DAOM 181602=DAOM 197198]|nr:hypothetical protein GLOIN_2v1774887 [Rhizophagus irregularis DAOM 181602=DAOM 197198]